MNLTTTLYTILVLGGTSPDVTVIPGFTVDTKAECEVMAENARARDPILVDAVTGRPVVMAFHKCVTLDAEQELERWQRAVKGQFPA